MYVYICMYVCMYVYIYIYTHTHLSRYVRGCRLCEPAPQASPRRRKRTAPDSGASGCPGGASDRGPEDCS